VFLHVVSKMCTIISAKCSQRWMVTDLGW